MSHGTPATYTATLAAVAPRSVRMTPVPDRRRNAMTSDAAGT
jgi:hypothetical protein